MVRLLGLQNQSFVGSSPTTPTMITFRYKDKQYTTNNLKNKLDKLGISIDEIEIMGNRSTEELDNSIQKYYFKNTITIFTNNYSMINIIMYRVRDSNPQELILIV